MVQSRRGSKYCRYNPGGRYIVECPARSVINLSVQTDRRGYTRRSQSTSVVNCFRESRNSQYSNPPYVVLDFFTFVKLLLSLAGLLAPILSFTSWFSIFLPSA